MAQSSLQVPAPILFPATLLPEVPLPESSAQETPAGPDHPLSLPPGEEGVSTVELSRPTGTEHFCPELWAGLGGLPLSALRTGSELNLANYEIRKP